MPQYIAATPRRPSDENWALRVTAVTLLAVLCMFVLGYFLSSHWSQEKQALWVQQQQYQDYRRATAPAPLNPASMTQSATSLPADMVQAQQVRARLMAHPAVTPGPGFDRPGVQSTGIAIVEAIDEAQSR